MKKFIYILVFGLFALAFNGYSQSWDQTVTKGTNYASYTGVATDTINGVATADAKFYVEISASSRYTFSYYVSGDTLTGCSGNVTIQPYGSYDGVTYTSLGSAVTWTTTADYDANTQENTFTNVYSGTYHPAADSTVTDARTITTTLPGTDYRFIKILLTGASGARVELQKVSLKVTPVDYP
jgi:hypothetical protein